MAVTLDKLALGAKAQVTRFDAELLSAPALARLNAVGISEGVEVEPLHRGVLLSHDPIAVRVGRMTLAVRVAQARAIEVDPL